MATATPTANRPLTACCTLSRRTSRSPKITTATPRADQMPARRPPMPLATMNAMVGTVASTMPRRPPSWSSTMCRSKTTPGSLDSPSPVALTRLPHVAAAGGCPPARSCPRRPRGRRAPGGGLRSAGAQLVPGVVDDALAVEGGEPAAGGERAPRLDARDAPAAQPDQRHGAGAVEELRLERRHGLPRGVDHRLQPPGHRHDGTLAAGAERLAAGARRLGAQFLGIDRLLVGGQSLKSPRQPADRTGLGHGPSVVLPGAGGGPVLPPAGGVRASCWAAIRAAASAGRVSGSASRTGMGSVPRTTTTARKASSSSAAASGVEAAGPLMVPRRNQRGPSTPRKRAGRRVGSGAG